MEFNGAADTLFHLVDGIADGQLSPEMASWIAKQFAIEAVPVRDVGLRDASDVQIFEAAKQADVVLVTKGSDFSHLIERLGKHRRLDPEGRPRRPIELQSETQTLPVG